MREHERGQWRARKPGEREEINYEDHNESHKTWREREVGREALCRRKEALNDVAGETAFCAALSLISAAHPARWVVGFALSPNEAEAE